MKKVIVTGVTGQDGSHMVDYLLSNTDHHVFGTLRRVSVKNYKNIEHLKNHERFKTINMDLNDPHSIREAVINIKPDYFINFAAQSFVASSWDYPIQTWETDSSAVLHILEFIRKFNPNCRFYNAGSSEEFGDVISTPQDESHPLRPQSPYGAAKCAARHIVRVYRESYDLYSIQGWLFNHEGTRRGIEFVTRKISNGIALIKNAIEKSKPIPVLKLGNLDAKRDWTDAEDLMEGVWKMLNRDEPKNYVLASGKMFSVRDFVNECLLSAEINFTKEGEGENEKYFYKNKLIVTVDPKLYRPAEVRKLCGDYSLAKRDLDWEPKTKFKDLVRKMYHNDYKLINQAL